MSFLNPQQQLAVEHVTGPLLVLAGAGSGKTRVIVHRIAHLLDLGTPASEILAVTFTNKAANEMKNRICTLKNAHVLACTFHSLGARILRESIHLLGYKNDFVIYDEEDSEKLLKSCLQGFEEKEFLRHLRHQISSAKNDLNEAIEPKFQPGYLLYRQKLKECNALDFDDLLYLTVKLLQENPDALLMYQKRWQFVLIDEYQDTNTAQCTIAKLLVGGHGNLFAVGDPDQSIYSWRGARYQNILNFEIDFPQAKVIKLEQNYRSTNIILQAANALIQHNSQRYNKSLWSALGDGSKIALYIGQNEKQEAEFVAQQVFQCGLNTSLQEMAIIYRTNAQSRPFEDALLKRKINYQIIGGVSFYQRKEVKDVLAYLKMLISDTDLISFLRTINLPKRGIGLTLLEKLTELSTTHSTPIFTFCEEALQDSSLLKLTSKQREGLSHYVQIIRTLRNQKKDLLLHKLIDETISSFNYLNFLKEDPETYQDRKENVEELISKAAEWEMEHPDSSLTLFLEELSLRTSSEEQSHLPSIKLMTLHNSKGLEFEAVFLVGLEEDLFPHINAKDDPEAIEEERRLCYVGMTRAKRKLYLCSTFYRFMWGTARFMRPSRFLKEIPSQYLQNLSQVSLQQEKEEESFNETPEAFQEGDSVFHKDFGKGVVQKAYEGSFGLTYEVLFDQTRRTLVAKFAKLQPQ